MFVCFGSADFLVVVERNKDYFTLRDIWRKRIRPDNVNCSIQLTFHMRWFMLGQPLVQGLADFLQRPDIQYFRFAGHIWSLSRRFCLAVCFF